MKLINKLTSYWLAATLLLTASVAMALESDKDQPIDIEADSVDIDDRNGISIYKGNVVLTQGSILIKADKITVTQKTPGSEHIEAVGKPVSFRQKMDGDKGMVTGRALKSEYQANSEILYLIGSAVLTQGPDSFRSDRITYDRAKAVVKAGASAKGRKRVKVTIGGKK